jgi:hypothetical protein
MRNTTSTNRAAALGAVALALAACAGGAGGPVMSHWTPAPPGSTWEVAQRNTGSFGKDAQLTWTRQDMRWKGAPAIGLKSSLGPTLVVEPVGGRYVTLLSPEGKPVSTWDPPIGWVYPLQVGSAWSQHQRLTLHATGKTIEFEFSCKVEGFEKVKVRAGTFDAFRIHCTNSVGSDDLYWTSPGVGAFVKTQLRRDAGNPFGPGTQDQELVSLPALRERTAANQ